MPLRHDLTRARDDQRLVHLVRRKGWTTQEGYVVAVGRRWSALLAVQPGLLDGLVVFRTDDVRALRKPSAQRRLSRRVATIGGKWPPTLPEELALDDIRSVLFTAGSLAPVLAIACERDNPRRFYVGRVHRITGKKVWLEEIDPSGRWSAPVSYGLEEITRVDLHTPYVTSLRAVAGPRYS